MKILKKHFKYIKDEYVDILKDIHIVKKEWDKIWSEKINDFDHLKETVFKSFTPYAEKHNVDIQIIVDLCQADFGGDFGMLEHILQNKMSNKEMLE